MNAVKTTSIELQENEIIYFDCSALLCDGFKELMIKNAKSLIESGNHISVHVSVERELKIEAENSADCKVKECLNYIGFFKEKGIVKLVGNPLEKGCSFQQYIELMLKYRSKKSLTVVTNNRDFASDLLMQNRLRSFEGMPIHVYALNDNGELTLTAGEITIEEEADDSGAESYTRFLCHNLFNTPPEDELSAKMKKLFHL